MTGPSRRELLATFLGLPAALTVGCHSSETPPLPDGEIVGASDTVGHRLRDGWRPMPPADGWENVGTVIVGGGVAGLSAAWRLARASIRDFTLLELEPAPGGTARSGRAAPGPYPWGAHYVPAPLPNNHLLLTLLDEMGVVEGRSPDGTPVIAEEVLCRDPQERIFFRGEWYEGLYLYAGASADDLAQLHRFHEETARWVAWRDGLGRRAFTLPVAHCSDDPTVTELDRLSMADWLGKHNFTSPRLRWLIEYACRDDYGCTAEQTSAWAGLFYFAARVAKPRAEAQPLMTWPEGNGRFVAHFQSKIGERVRLGWAASEIVPTAAGVEVIAVDRAGTSVRGFRAKQAIFAAPQFLARYLIRPYRERPPAHLAAFEHGSWVVANLHVRERPASAGFPLAWDNVLYETRSLGYVVNTHQLGVDRGPAVFTWYYPLCDDNPRAARGRLLGSDWADWAEVVLADLTHAHPEIRFLTERLDVMRWGHAMIRPRPGLFWGGARKAAVTPLGGIHFAGADLSGVALFEEAFYHGVRAAEEVLAARGVKFESLLGDVT